MSDILLLTSKQNRAVILVLKTKSSQETSTENVSNASSAILLHYIKKEDWCKSSSLKLCYWEAVGVGGKWNVS